MLTYFFNLLKTQKLRIFRIRVFYYTKYVDLNVPAISESTALNAAKRIFRRGICQNDIIHKTGVIPVDKEFLENETFGM